MAQLPAAERPRSPPAAARPGGWGFAKHNSAELRECYHAPMARPTGDRIHRKAINTPGHAHELTFSCYHRFQFLKAERTSQWLAEAIQSARVKHSFDLWAFVFMPEHVHLIVR